LGRNPFRERDRAWGSFTNWPGKGVGEESPAAKTGKKNLRNHGGGGAVCRFDEKVLKGNANVKGTRRLMDEEEARFPTPWKRRRAPVKGRHQ